MIEKGIVLTVVALAVAMLVVRFVRIYKSGGCDGCRNKGSECACCANGREKESKANE